jgi:hypothetical protein
MHRNAGGVFQGARDYGREADGGTGLSYMGNGNPESAPGAKITRQISDSIAELPYLPLPVESRISLL